MQVKDSPVSAPERAARTIVDLVRVPRREVAVGALSHTLMAQSKLAPALSERLMTPQVDKLHLSHRDAAPPGPGNLYEASGQPGTADGDWGGRRRTRFRRAAGAAARNRRRRRRRLAPSPLT